jgi:hypothetical protein
MSREWDSNGTVFGFNAGWGPKFQAGEFGHNDFYPVCIAACQQTGGDGSKCLRAMLLLDEIRGRYVMAWAGMIRATDCARSHGVPWPGSTLQLLCTSWPLAM